MFTANLKPNDGEYTKIVIGHMRKLIELGYAGFDLPIAPTPTRDHQAEIQSYLRLRETLDKAGLRDIEITTNVGTTRTFDPTSMYTEQREIALSYLKSRVDITKVLRGKIMAGPIVMPYGVFPTTDFNEPIWSDALQNWLPPRYKNAQPIIERLGEYADTKDVSVAIEPVDHWETPAPNMVQDVLDFLVGVKSPRVGVCVDSAHVVLGSNGPGVFTAQAAQFKKSGRLHYVHISAPDRGAVLDSWIPWTPFLGPILEQYSGPFLIEVFNAIPVFLNSLRLTRRKFWIPGEDAPVAGVPDAYTIAHEAIATVRREMSTLTQGLIKA